MNNDERTQQLLVDVATRQKELIDVAGRILRSNNDKDAWDKLGVLSTFFSAVVLALATFFITHMYNERQSARDAVLRDQELWVSKIGVVQTLMPYITAVEPDKRLAAYAAIRALGADSLATDLAMAIAKPGNVSAEMAALGQIGSSGSAALREHASAARAVVRAKQDYLDSLKAALHAQPLTTSAITEILSLFQFDNAPECSMPEAKRMLAFLGVSDSAIVERGSGIVTAHIGHNQEITIWLNSYGATGQYGLRYGDRDGQYFGSNDTLIHVAKASVHPNYSRGG